MSTGDAMGDTEAEARTRHLFLDGRTSVESFKDAGLLGRRNPLTLIGDVHRHHAIAIPDLDSHRCPWSRIL